MKIVVDTNIVFSGILSPTGTISDILLNSSDAFTFYSPTYLIDELDNHKEKILKISGFTENDLGFLLRHLLKKIHLINLEFIGEENWIKATKMAKDIDEFDIPFLALALELKSPLWTGDKKLIKGLTKKGIDWVLTTNIISEIRDSE